MSNINLDGGEISVIRALGFGGAPMLGADLKSRVGSLGEAELFEILQTLGALGYISSSPELSGMGEVDKTQFYVNPGYARDLKEALDPQAAPRKPRRMRRE